MLTRDPTRPDPTRPDPAKIVDPVTRDPKTRFQHWFSLYKYIYYHYHWFANAPSGVPWRSTWTRCI